MTSETELSFPKNVVFSSVIIQQRGAISFSHEAGGVFSLNK